MNRHIIAPIAHQHQQALPGSREQRVIPETGLHRLFLHETSLPRRYCSPSGGSSRWHDRISPTGPFMHMACDDVTEQRPPVQPQTLTARAASRLAHSSCRRISTQHRAPAGGLNPPHDQNCVHIYVTTGQQRSCPRRFATRHSHNPAVPTDAETLCTLRDMDVRVLRAQRDKLGLGLFLEDGQRRQKRIFGRPVWVSP